jgi:hypothetical protein
MENPGWRKALPFRKTWAGSRRQTLAEERKFALRNQRAARISGCNLPYRNFGLESARLRPGSGSRRERRRFGEGKVTEADVTKS